LKLHVFIGTALSGKTGFLAEKMAVAHRENALYYTFLGPSGVFVREFSEWFARGMNSSIPRSNFLVIDQFAVELFGSSHPDMIHADEHLLNVFIASILGSASQGDLGSFYPLKDSLRLAAFVVEAVKDAKDDGEAELSARLANDQARSLVQFVLKELNTRYGSNLFDTFDAYRNIDTKELLSQIKSRIGSKLFLDGFTNLSDAQMIFLSRIIPLFDEAFMTLDPALLTSESWIELKGMLEAQSVEIYEKQLMSSVGASEPLERLLADQGPQVNLEGSFIQVAHYKDPEDELIQVCRQIKKRIVDDGMEPGDIAIVLNNFSERAREFSRKLEEYGIPARVSGEEPLSSSIAVQLLILPFKAALAGYPPQILISMLDHGLGSADTADFDLDNLEALATGAGLHMGPRRASLQDRREEWRSKLEDHLTALKQRLEVLKQDESVYDSELQAHELEIQLCQDLVQKSVELFQSLERIDATRLSQVALQLYVDELASWMAPLKNRFLNNPVLENEVMAIGKFEHILSRLEVILSTMGKRVLTLAEFMAFMEIMLSSEGFRPSPPLANTVEILSLHSARFKHRSLKFIVNFNDGIFPTRRTNPLYSLEDLPSGNPGYYKVKELEQREALYSCLCTSSEVVITYPVASREGEPMVPSLWLDAWSYDKAGSLKRLISPMSTGELKIEFGYRLAKQVNTVIPDDVLELLNPLKIYAESEFCWGINEKTIAEYLLGTKFSYTKLSEFKSCPFKFFLRRVMRLEEQSSDFYALSPLELGSTYHAVLKNLYDLKQEGMSLDQAIECGRVRHEVEAITQRFLAANRIRSLPAVREAMINGATSRVQTYLEFELGTPEKAFIGARTLTEIPFSIRLAEMANIVSKTAQKYGDMVFLGRIDRIDLNVIAAGKGKGKKKQESKIYDIVLSDYKSSSAGDWDQLKLYTLALLSLDLEALPKNPALMRSFFRIIKSGNISLKLDAFPDEGRMEMHDKGKTSLTFSDIDRDLLATLDGIFEARQFLPGRTIDGNAGNCHRCGFKQNCEPLLYLRGGSQ
jgi:ATP-dependent helicase/DNAse subunit B